MGAHRLLGLVVVVACGGRGDPPPEEGGGAVWHVQVIPECGFTVELPAPARRDETPIPGDPSVRSILYLTSGVERQIVSCEILPAPETRPLAEVLPLQLERRRAIYASGGFPPITEVTSWIEPGGRFGRYRVAFERGFIEHRFTIDGRELHEVSGSSNGSPASNMNLERVLASYMVR